MIFYFKALLLKFRWLLFYRKACSIHNGTLLSDQRCGKNHFLRNQRGGSSTPKEPKKNAGNHKFHWSRKGLRSKSIIIVINPIWSEGGGFNLTPHYRSFAITLEVFELGCSNFLVFLSNTCCHLRVKTGLLYLLLPESFGILSNALFDLH